MVYGQRKFKSLGAKYDQRRRTDPGRSFQYKYSTYLAFVITGSALLFFIPAFYFISQNYHIFTSLAFDSYPSLIKHLDREINWLRFFIVMSAIAITGISFFMSLKVMNKLLGPVTEIEKHIQFLTRGQWDQPEVQADNEDFKNLAMAYNYFYRTLKVNTEIELKMLEKLAIDPQNREAHSAWTQLMDMKRQRLGLSQTATAKTSDPVASTGEVEHLRRVS